MTVSSNPAQVEFPRDTWGFTTALRKYGLLVAGAIRGDEAKLDLFIQTLGILAQHAQARIESDKAARAARLAEIATSGRVNTAGIALPEQETETND
ncbi:hypothetical protein EVB84_050 [Rhizobium phage RHph_Y48]|uniref:Uncharacterized protein n=1 Tax=Rhizobium phage RHph_Y1_20 TaxID=2509571 RepID=A0A7S5URX6_9CAUD|nr:hypothetical protein EVB57_048 [Rhizobium phage RHph_Y1_20]QIG69994.1 hypothetical protein EVB84_050 [Rhizobium phage RHph_Y48]QIG70046.1 hypothetical protein EVB85_050 [Rhizobium phage RHph_Y86]QIG70098.1 hypothetical protein EVB86_050 [Rhizobium phage RHph_Y2_7]